MEAPGALKMKTPRQIWSLTILGALMLLYPLVVWLSFPTYYRMLSVEGKAVALTESCDQAILAFREDLGSNVAARLWISAGSQDSRFDLLKPYLASPIPVDLARATPAGYRIALPDEIDREAGAELFVEIDY